MKVWVTRTEPGASETAARLRALGHDSLVAPLLAVRALPFSAPERVGAIAFTSRNGVAAVTDWPEAAAWRDLPVFAVGDATAQAARAAGFRRVESARGDVEALRHLLTARRADWSGPVLHPGARQPTGELTIDGVEVLPVTAYEAVEQPLPIKVRATWPGLDAVLIHSPRAARVLVRVTVGLPLNRLSAACISKAAAQPLLGVLARIIVADQPTETAVLHALGKLSAEG
jgi:uroporphyrinogen-III synthase